MSLFLLSCALILIAILAGALFSFNLNWIRIHYHKVIVLNMSVLLTFTILELIPLAVDYSHEGVVFVVLGVLIPMLFHHRGHDHNGENQFKMSITVLLIGFSIHNFFDGIIITTGLFVDQKIGIVIVTTMLLHKLTETIMISSLLFIFSQNPMRVIRYLVSLSLINILGMLFATFLFERFEGLAALSSIAISISAGLFLFISLTSISREVEYSKIKFASLYPFIGSTIYLSFHLFSH